MRIHPTAVIAGGASIAEDAEIGPYAIVEDGVTIGPGCRIAGHVQIVNRVDIGSDCAFGHGSVIGADPQDKDFAAETSSGVVVGDGNVFREHVTVHRSTAEGGITRIGDRNYFMVASHVGHDTTVGNDNTLANQCLLGGHISVGDGTFLGGASAFHQFVRVGDLCMVRGLSAVSQDVPPYVILSGVNTVRGLNAVGMRRAGFSRATRESIKTAFAILLRQGLNLGEAYEKAAALELSGEAKDFVDFFRTPSRKGICHC